MGEYRYCFGCSVLIVGPGRAGIGYTKAGDLLDYLEDKRKDVRLLCGRCGERFQWTKQGTLTNRIQEESDG